jgi:hypothetical protein
VNSEKERTVNMPPSHVISSNTDAAYTVTLKARDSGLRRNGIFGALAARGSLKKELEQHGIRRSRASDVPVWVLVTLLVVAAASATIGVVTHSLSGQTAVGLAVAVLTVAGLLVAVLQWRHGLSEKAFDALYRRIAIANEMWLQAFKDLPSDEEGEVTRQRPELYRFFVFTEIDSLEYAARRYRFGLGMNRDVVRRAVRHFRGRCSSDTFCQAAAKCAEEGAYFDGTKEMVQSIIREARELREAVRAEAD